MTIEDIIEDLKYYLKNGFEYVGELEDFFNYIRLDYDTTDLFHVLEQFEEDINLLEKKIQEMKEENYKEYNPNLKI